MTKISYFGKQNSSPGSIVPLAMFLSFCPPLFELISKNPADFGVRALVFEEDSTQFLLSEMFYVFQGFYSQLTATSVPGEVGHRATFRQEPAGSEARIGPGVFFGQKCISTQKITQNFLRD